MGRHLAREEEPPPRDKPRYRFLVAISGIVLLAFVAMVVVNAIFPEQGPQAVAGPEDPGTGGNPFPAVPGDPGLTPPPTDATPGATTAPSGPPTPPRTTSATSNPPAPPSGPVSGAYSAEEPYPGGDFQAQVRLTNSGGSAQPWQIRLRYPDNVTGVVAIWVDSYPNQPQPPGTDQGAFVFTGSAPLAAGETIVVKFHMNATGENISPSECSVNGRACT